MVIKSHFSCLPKLTTNIAFTEKGIKQVLQNLDPNKAHVHYMIDILVLEYVMILFENQKLFLKSASRSFSFMLNGIKEMLLLSKEKVAGSS